MVNKLGSIFVLVCSLFSSNTLADISTNPIVIQIKDTSIFYGKSLDINLSIDTKSGINITELLKPFSDSLDYVIANKIENTKNIVYKIKVYPSEIGKLKVPPLVWNNFKTQAYDFDVKAPLAKNRQPISLALNKTKPNPWVREQNKIIVTIITADKNIILERNNIITQGIESYLIPQVTEVIRYKGTLEYKHTIGWNVFFLYGQKNILLLPEVEYHKDSVPVYKFHLGKKSFRVKKLPIYINPLIPVGSLGLQTHYLELPFFLMQPKTTSILQYSLIGTGVPAKWLPSLAQKYNLISQTDIQYSHVKTSLSTKIKNNNVVGSKLVDIAFTPLSNGLIQFKKLNLQYFEPDTGVLKTLQYEDEKIFVLNWLLQLILLFMLLFITSWSIIKLAIISKRRVDSYIQLSKSKSALAKSSKPDEIRHALILFSISQNWPKNLTINQWLYKFRSKYIVSDNLTDALWMLNYALYAHTKLEDNKNEIVKFIILKEFNNLKKKSIALKRIFKYFLSLKYNRQV